MKMNTYFLENAEATLKAYNDSLETYVADIETYFFVGQAKIEKFIFELESLKVEIYRLQVQYAGLKSNER
jgi:chromosome segregation ATPase